MQLSFNPPWVFLSVVYFPSDREENSWVSCFFFCLFGLFLNKGTLRGFLL